MNKKTAPFLTFAAIQAVFHILMTENPILDGLSYFAHALDSQSLFSYLAMRYRTWTSRLVLEAFEATLSRHMTTWRICDTLVWILMMISLSMLLGCFPKKGDAEEQTRRKSAMNWIIAAGILCYPIIEMSSAGWISTMMVFAWTLSFGLYALTIPVRLLRGEKIGIVSYICGTLAMIYACNAEQSAAVLFGILLLLALYDFIQRKRIAPMLLVFLGIDALGLLFVLTCPGNKARSGAEISDGIRDFAMLSKADKVYLGFFDTMKNLLSYNRLLLFVTVFLFVLTVMKTKRILPSAIALTPLLITMRAGTVGSFFQNYLYVLDSEELLGTENYMQPKAYLTVVFYLVFLTCFAMTIAILSESRAEWLMLTAVFVLGLLSRVVMGFSPSLYASGTRTMIYLHFSLLFVALYFVWKERERIREHRKTGFGLGLFAAAMGIFGTMNSLGFISVWV